MNKPSSNIVVLDNPSATADVIDAFTPLDPHTGANQDMSSREAIAASLTGSNRRTHTAQSERFFQFKHQSTRTNAGHFTGVQHLDTWLQILTKECQKAGQKIDVLVIPEPDGKGPLRYTGTLANSYRKLFSDLRKVWPHIRIVALRPTADSGYVTPMTFETVYTDDPAKTPSHSHVHALSIAHGTEIFHGTNREFAEHLRSTMALTPATPTPPHRAR